MGQLLDLVKPISTAVHNKLTVILGKPGSAKTTASGTYPKPILYVQVGKDGGSEVLKNYSDEEIKIFDLETMIEEKGHLGKKLMILLKELEENGTGPYKTVIIDAYSSIEENIVDYLEKSKGKRLSLDERGSIGAFMLNLRDKLVDLSRKEVEYVLISHVKTKKNTDTTTGEELMQLIPKMSENNGNNLLERASNVMYAVRRTVIDDANKPGVKFLMYIGAHPNIDTKIRTAGKNVAVGTYIEEFTYDKLQQILNGKEKIEDSKKLNVVESSKNPFEDAVTDTDTTDEW